jgi:hypothetical protein
MNAPTPTPAISCGTLVYAWGTKWRLRSLVAMGRDTVRIAAALGVYQALAERILSGDAEAVSPELRDLVRQLWTRGGTSVHLSRPMPSAAALPAPACMQSRTTGASPWA